GVDRNLYDKDKNLVGTGRQELLAASVGMNSWEEWEKAQLERDYTDQELAELERNRREKYRIKDRAFPAPMADEAFYGLAGEVVRVIEPVSEACREAILGQFLVAFGKSDGAHHLPETGRDSSPERVRCGSRSYFPGPERDSLESRR